MLFSTPAEYAIRGVAELACKSPDRYMLLDELVQGTDLPRDFMAKVFQRLVKGNVLKSVKGRNGGFMLARRPHEINLMHVIEAIEGPLPLDGCVVGLSQCNDAMPCAQHDLYKPIRQRLKDYMNTTTVADLAASLKAKKSWQQAQETAAK
ncbi:MAG TPA: Rrf2 family transcriptional regulator [Tepidisphaeraceae bacterium]|nr:Rrf2 family transcriptional regulator [Tepidisphaeraceae bacterium]